MQNSGAVRFGLIGAGGIGDVHAACLQDLRAEGIAELVVCADVDPRRAGLLAGRYGVEATGDVDALLARSDIDAVTVCTPSGLHAAAGIAAAVAGKHVLVEKPMDVTLEAADRLIAACRNAGVRLGVVSQRRFDPGMQRAKKAIDAGRLGRPLLGEASVKWYRSPEYYASAGWRATWELDGGGALMNQGIHTIDLLLWSFGPVESVSAYTATLARNIPVEDVAAASLRFRSGALGVIIGSTAVYPGLPEELHLHGSDGSISLAGGAVTTWALRDEFGPVGDFGKAPPPVPPAEAAPGTDPAFMGRTSHRAQIADFVAAIHEGREPAVTGADNRRALAVILAIYESARTGRPVQTDSEGSER